MHIPELGRESTLVYYCEMGRTSSEQSSQSAMAFAGISAVFIYPQVWSADPRMGAPSGSQHDLLQEFASLNPIAFSRQRAIDEGC